MKIITIVGARPQFIKAAAISREIEKYSDIEEIIVHTGQHYDKNMSEIFFEEMKIPRPKYNLGINSLSHGAMTGRMLEKIEEIILDEKPDFVVVFGDTNSTLAGALAAKKLHVKIAHVEAGLRSLNMKMPEEVNRILTDRISDILFCPTDKAVENLNSEGFRNFETRIVKSGDVMQDTAMFYSKFAKKPEFEISEKYILATIHRAENTDVPERLKSIFSAFKEISKTIDIVLPLHPRTKKIIENLGLKTHGIKIVDPVSYLEVVYLLKNANLVMTDSGGVQKEAFFFQKPCVTLRDETEWVELIENGYNLIVGANSQKIISASLEMLNKEIDYSRNLYGGGTAAEKIVKELLK
ncbi:MAG: UDP-N-acetylglucosamine 2-epimerase (non-hydrolyzing) [Bacteroidales bacterium]|nr:UDP-N-acetylglucosamine 2-epimerase (non-hydrolyzing) [Bacteroidales bacterium]